MSQPPLVRLDSDGDIALLVIDNPPVNALSPAVAQQMQQALETFERSMAWRALVICCVGRTFVAGGDIASFNDPDFSATPLNRTLARLERLDRPVVAALHGFVLGGGLELAMACHWRVADAATQLGLPEIKLGLIPGSLGTQRLPRLVGMARAHQMISTGDSVDAAQALAAGLVDEVATADVTQAAISFARQRADQSPATRATCDQPADMAGLPADFFTREREQAYAQRARFPASLALVDALEAVAAPFDVGEVVEARGFELLRRSPESKALRYLFFAQRKARRGETAEQANPQAQAIARTRQAFLQALAGQVLAGVSHTRLALALQGFGFTRLPEGFIALAEAPRLLDEPQLIQPLLDAIVNTAAEVLAEGCCDSASAIDVAWTQDHGFPRFLGGPLYNADASGLARVVDRLNAQGHPPCALLSDLARTGARLCEYRRTERVQPPALA